MKLTRSDLRRMIMEALSDRVNKGDEEFDNHELGQELNTNNDGGKTILSKKAGYNAKSGPDDQGEDREEKLSESHKITISRSQIKNIVKEELVKKIQQAKQKQKQKMVAESFNNKNNSMRNFIRDEVRKAINNKRNK